MIAALDLFGDPLHIHTQGRAARALLDGAREQVAGAIGAQPDEIVFTSGGTESIALAIWGGVRAVRELGTRIVARSRRAPGGGRRRPRRWSRDGFEVVTIPVDRYGRVDLDRFAIEVSTPGHAPRLRPTREPRAGDAPAGRRGRPPRSRGGRPVPHRRVPDGRPAPRRRARPSAWTSSRSPRTSSAVPPASEPSTCGGASGSPRIRAATIGSGSVAPGWRTPPGSRGWRPPSPPPSPTMADRAARAVDAHRDASGIGSRREVPGATRPRASHASHAPPRGLQRRRTRSGDADDDPRRSRVPGGRGLALQRPSRGSLPGPRADRLSRTTRVPGQLRPTA